MPPASTASMAASCKTSVDNVNKLTAEKCGS
jgi:hypothetical protein